MLEKCEHCKGEGYFANPNDYEDIIECEECFGEGKIDKEESEC